MAYTPEPAYTYKIGEELNIHELNLLIEQSFGRGFRGDYYDQQGLDMKQLISRRGDFFPTIAGSIDRDCHGRPEDGSIISVYSKYVENGKRYAQLYEERTGKRVMLFELKGWEKPREISIHCLLPRPADGRDFGSDTLPRTADPYDLSEDTLLRSAEEPILT